MGVTVPVFFAYLAYSKELIGPKGKVALDDLRKHKIAVVTGIANPKPLISYLQDASLGFEHLDYPDHHHFTSKDLEKIQAYPLVLTTEKDYVRLSGKVENLHAIGVKHVILDKGKEQLTTLLNAYLRPPSQSLN